MIEVKVKRSSYKILITMFIISAFVNISLGQSVFVGKSGPKGKVLSKYIEPAVLKTIVENPVDSIWILDVRSEKAYSAGHIPTAKSFPVATIPDRMNEIHKDQYLIIYCTVGANAQIVSKHLKKAGYKRTVNWGGISRWEWEKETAPNLNPEQ